MTSQQESIVRTEACGCTETEGRTLLCINCSRVYLELQESEFNSFFILGPIATTFADVAGLSHAKYEMSSHVIRPLTGRQHMGHARYGCGPPLVLLYGPPGAGKTHLVWATIGEIWKKSPEVTFLNVSLADLLQKRVDETLKKMQELFEYARKQSPSIIFFDPIDAILKRDLKDDEEALYFMKIAFLGHLKDSDGTSLHGTRHDIQVIGTCDSLGDLDKAELSRARFVKVSDEATPFQEGIPNVLSSSHEEFSSYEGFPEGLCGGHKPIKKGPGSNATSPYAMSAIAKTALKRILSRIREQGWDDAASTVEMKESDDKVVHLAKSSIENKSLFQFPQELEKQKGVRISVTTDGCLELVDGVWTREMKESDEMGHRSSHAQMQNSKHDCEAVKEEMESLRRDHEALKARWQDVEALKARLQEVEANQGMIMKNVEEVVDALLE